MRTQRTVILLAAMALAVAGPAGAQEVFTDLEIGYQWVDVSGNEDMYRTQLNDDNGLVIGDFNLALVDTDGSVGLFDRLTIDASGFGGSPAGLLRLTSDLDDRYALRLTYRQFEHFSALPAWANPDLAEGITPGQHTWQRDRDLFDLELQILPGRTLTPIVGFRHNSADSFRTTTYHVGQDEFRLDSDLEETETEFRAGLAFRLGRFSGAVIQGWRNYEGTERSLLASGAGGGNGSRPILGVDPTLDALTRTATFEADTPITSAHIRGMASEFISLDANFILADGEGDGMTDEILGGSLVSYQLNRYFEGREDSVSSRTENPFWRGDLRIGFRLSDHADLDVVADTRHRELEGWALVSSLYLETLNFSGANPEDIQLLTEIQNGYERDDTRLEAQFRARDLGPLSVWVHAGTTSSELDVNQDVAEIILTDGQEGLWERDLTSLAIGGRLDFGGFGIAADAVHEDADAVVMRTDFEERLRLRLRLDWTPCEWFEMLGTAERLTADSGETGFSGTTDHWAVDLGIQAATDLWIRGAWDHYDTETRILIRDPARWDTVPSDHAEGGDMLEGRLEWRRDAFGVVAGFSDFENEGTFPFELQRLFGRAWWDFAENFGASVEIEEHDYSEEFLPLADFDASRYAVFVRYRN